MGSSKLAPPGWYTDPTGRHQGRYWDSSHWTEQVEDDGVQAVEPPTRDMPEAPPISLPVAKPTGVGSPAGGYRVLAVRRWRVLPLQIGVVAFELALVFEVVVDMVLRTIAVNSFNGTENLPAESTMQWTSWLYNYTPGFITYAHPPIILFLVMAFGAVLAASMLQSSAQVVVNGLPGSMWKRSRRMKELKRGGTEVARLRSAMREAGFARSMLRWRGRRVSAVAVAVAAAVSGAVAGYAVVENELLLGDATVEGLPMSVGWGPVVCLIGSALLLIGILLAMLPVPGSSLKVSVLPDGSVVPEEPTT